MTSHDEYAALLDAFLDGELPEAEAGEVRVHLSECADCQAYVADALAIRDAFPDVEETIVPDGFAESVLAALPPRPVSWRVQWAKVVLPLAACAALVILLHGIADIGTGGGASMSSYAEDAFEAADMDAGGDDADTVPPQAPELYGVAESQSARNTTTEEPETDMIPFSMRSSETEVPEEAEEESVANGSAAPAAAKAIPDGHAVAEALPDEAPATKELPDEAPATGTVPEEEPTTENVPGEGAATGAGAVLDRGTTTENVPDAEAVSDRGTATDADAVTETENEVTLLGESGANEETEQDATADLSSGAVSVWTLPAEALALFDGYDPAEKTESGIWYALTPGEFDALSRKLAGMKLEIVPGAAAPPPPARPDMEYVFVPL